MSQHVVGVDLGGTHLQVGVVDEANRIIAEHRTTSGAAEGPGAVLDRIAEATGVAAREAGCNVRDLAAVGVASVLIPLPGAPGDHQTANAGALVAAGGARMLADEDLTGATLKAAIEDMLDDPSTLADMDAAARSVGRHDAADRVAQLLEEHAR